MPNAPPTYQAYPIRTQTLEFLLHDTTGAIQITRGQLRKMLIFSTSTTNAYPIWDSVRLKHIQHWSSTVAAGFTKIEHEYLGIGAPGQLFSAAGTNANPGKLMTRPPASSFAKLWCSASNDSDPLVAIVGTVGDIVRITIQYTDANVSQTALTGTGGSSTGLTQFNWIFSSGGTLRSTESNTVTSAFV